MGLEDLTRYQGGELARRFYSSDENRVYTNGALYQLASDLEIEEKAKGFIDGAMASEEGIKKAIADYSKKYKEGFESCSVDDLKSHYEKFIAGYLENKEANKVRKELDRFSKENMKDITSKIKKAKYILDGEKNNYTFSEEEKKEAKDTIEKYGKILTIIQYLEDIKFENLRKPSVERSQKIDFKNLVDKLEL
jgi:hypothetical protein